PGPYMEAVKALKKTIGVSINGGGTFREGTAGGRKGRIVESLDAINSVDFVTRAGRGGKILESVLESAIAEDALINNDALEATANDRMDHLRSAVRQAHGGDQKSAWVRDQDAEASTVWFDVHDYRSDTGAKTYQQAYKVGKNDVNVELVGDPTEVRSVTNYVPVNPAGPTPTKESEEDPMATTQIEEAEKNRLVEQAGRVPALETERDAEKARADKLHTENGQLKVRESAVAHARAKVAKDNAKLPGSVVDRIVSASTGTVPLKESGDLDTEAFDKAIDKARTAEESYLAGLAQASGAGKVTGFGGVVVESGDDKTLSFMDLDEALNIKKEG
ncbi:MAG: hypothetical protein JWQ74_452, partial [Marmoricola sp.]|nr:hypothetical protein [Marmoricola sp.]